MKKTKLTNFMKEKMQEYEELKSEVKMIEINKIFKILQKMKIKTLLFFNINIAYSFQVF